MIKKVQETQKKTNTLQADFRQEKTLALLAKPEVSTGHVRLLEAEQRLWIYDAPKRVQMLIANGMLTTYYPELNKAERIEVKRFQDRIFKYMGASGAIDELARYFNFTFTNTADKPTYVLDLDAEEQDGREARAAHQIWIDKKIYLTTQFEYTEGDGDMTRYEFTNIKIERAGRAEPVRAQPAGSVRVEQMKLQ